VVSSGRWLRDEAGYNDWPPVDFLENEAVGGVYRHLFLMPVVRRRGSPGDGTGEGQYVPEVHLRERMLFACSGVVEFGDFGGGQCAVPDANCVDLTVEVINIASATNKKLANSC